MAEITEICKGLNSFFESAKKPVEKLPDLLLYCSMFSRPGLSSSEIAAHIYGDLSGAGIPMGNNTDGSPNLVKTFIFSVIDQYNQARGKGEVNQVLLPPGFLNLTVIGNKATNLTGASLLGQPLV